MNTKLTLNIERDLIQIAKKYAQKSNQSLSSLVQNYLKHLIYGDKSEVLTGITHTVRNLSGIINLADDYNYKKEYQKHIVDKYS